MYSDFCIEVLDLCSQVSEPGHEAAKGLIISLPKVSYGSLRDLVRVAGDILCAKAFDESVKAVDRSFWKASKPR